MSLVRLIARPMLASIFVVQGYKSLRDPKPLVPGAEKFINTVGKRPAAVASDAESPQSTSRPLTGEQARLAGVRLPADPQTLVRVNAAAQLAGGVALATGTLPRIASLVLTGSLVPATMIGHPFWEKTDPIERNQQRIHFMKNVGLAGGLLLSAADRKRKRRRPKPKEAKRNPSCRCRMRPSTPHVVIAPARS